MHFIELSIDFCFFFFFNFFSLLWKCLHLVFSMFWVAIIDRWAAQSNEPSTVWQSDGTKTCFHLASTLPGFCSHRISVKASNAVLFIVGLFTSITWLNLHKEHWIGLYRFNIFSLVKSHTKQPTINLSRKVVQYLIIYQLLYNSSHFC